MEETKMSFILESMQGITQSEWEKLKHVIDACFNNEAAIQKKQNFDGAPRSRR